MRDLTIKEQKFVYGGHDDDPEPRPKGNNGVGNGEDPQPPGMPRVNDGPDTGPGDPGTRRG